MGHDAANCSAASCAVGLPQPGHAVDLSFVRHPKGNSLAPFSCQETSADDAAGAAKFGGADLRPVQ